MLLSCSGKKVTKEAVIGEAIELIAPAIRATSPMYPTRRALGVGSTEFRCGIFRSSTSLRAVCRRGQFAPNAPKSLPDYSCPVTFHCFCGGIWNAPLQRYYESSSAQWCNHHRRTMHELKAAACRRRTVFTCFCQKTAVY